MRHGWPNLHLCWEAAVGWEEGGNDLCLSSVSATPLDGRGRTNFLFPKAVSQHI